MHILLIENQPFANQIKDKGNDIEVYNGDLNQSVESVAAQIKNQFENNRFKQDDVFIISTHLKIEDAMLSENKGIKLLKLLRLHHINNHVILYSWLNREMLMANHRNTIIFSKGVSFYRLPDFLVKLPDINFNQISKEKADKIELLPLFRAEYDPNDRHFDANKFGVWQLMKVHDVWDGKNEEKTKQNGDDEIRKKINDYLNSYRGKIVQFISEYEAENLKSRIEEEVERRNKDALKRKEEYEKEKQDINDKEDSEKPSIRQTNVNSNVGEDNPDSIMEIRKALNKNKSERKIIFVDDMAEEGWAQILSQIIYGETYQKAPDFPLQVIVPDSKKMPNEIADEIIDKCKEEKAVLIILDLRLKNEVGCRAPADISGFQVLQELNKKTPPCAILVFTASNKVWSLKEAFKGNVVSYWTKGGLDRPEGMDDSVNNYLDLICQIYFLTGYKWLFELLNRISDTKKEIKIIGNKYWWEWKPLEYKCKNNCYQRKLTKKTDIVLLLDRAIETVQSDLRQMFFFDNSEKARNTMVNAFIMRIAYILEQIHEFKDESAHFIPLSKRMKLEEDKDRKDKVQPLLDVRNNSAHHGFISQNKEDVTKFVNYVMDYLLIEPEEIKNLSDNNPAINSLKEKKQKRTSDLNSQNKK
jgi:CheY-like chemotaxis protein